ncbi:EAL domain-containing protein [Faecalispora anaeroviscerum]|uniref:EAL domain-containing protein n=1 Tax=Faecalispora anaeroviscerum TaxID=2991836 RepID=UPI0024B8DF66|nr:EAL domain-containing protein [Faecalispora anaeroviscerum]
MIKETYSVLLLMTCGASVACGLYAVGGSLTRLNRLFLAICAALAVWAFGLALTGAARTEEICAIGRRVAPLGWGMIGSLTMHAVLLLTGREALLKKRWLFLLIYLPAALAICAFTVFPLFGLNPDTLVRTQYGWVNTSKTDGWDWCYYIYIVLYVTLAAVLLLRWGKRSSSSNEKKQAKIITFSFLIASVLGYATDVLPAFLPVRFPQVSAVFALVMIFAVGYCINRYHFLQPAAISQNEMILSKSTRTNVYLYLGLVLFVGAALLFAGRSFYDEHENAIPVEAVSGLLVIFAIFLASVEHLQLKDIAKEMLVSLSFALMIPFYTLWFSDRGIDVSWSFAFVLMIICLLFNRLIILSTVIVSAFLTQLFAWGYTPPEVLIVSEKNYLGRIGVILFAAAFALYVNKIYTSRLRENSNHLTMQSIASDISHSFVSSRELNIDTKLYAALERCGSFIECDRAYLVLLNTKTATVRYAVEWVSQATDRPPNTLDDATQSICPEIFRQLKDKEALVLKDTRFLPRAAAKLRALLLAHSIRALVAVPIRSKGGIMGFLGFHASRPLSMWNLDSIAFIEIVGLILSDAVIKADDEKKLNYLAFHDQLTGLLNRTQFKKKLAEQICSAEKAHKMIGVVFLDLDAFKSVNDTLGHDQGDRLLMEVSKALKKSIRTGDEVARFGGDEFILMLNQISSGEELIRVMDRLMEVVQRPIQLAEQEFFVTVSAGVALYPQDGDAPELLLKNADTAMYRAKSEGKGRYVICSQEMKDEIQEKTQMVNRLYHALEKNQLVLYYQPQIDVATRQIVGMEALVRWNLPERGIVGPAEFIPLAEQTGLIYAIGEWVMREACLQNKRWLEMGCENLRMAVNVSVQQLRNPKFHQLVEEILQTTNLPPHCLELEITESVANGNTDNIVSMLHQLKALGVSISIDDFGTEYSSLSRLKLLPIDRIKMDTQFVHGIEKDSKDRAISKIIINLAKNLRMKVIAEGVETEPQLAFLSQKMCDEVQGFYYYRPMPANKAETLLRENLCTQKENTLSSEMTGADQEFQPQLP